MLSGRGLCDELITRPEESYRLRCVVVILKRRELGGPGPLGVGGGGELSRQNKPTKVLMLAWYILFIFAEFLNLSLVSGISNKNVFFPLSNMLPS